MDRLFIILLKKADSRKSFTGLPLAFLVSWVFSRLYCMQKTFWCFLEITKLAVCKPSVAKGLALGCSVWLFSCKLWRLVYEYLFQVWVRRSNLCVLINSWKVCRKNMRKELTVRSTREKHWVRETLNKRLARRRQDSIKTQIIWLWSNCILTTSQGHLFNGKN